ncbi:MAG: hypothetical protein KC457_33410, partial [Myxococcales bacterium]|nr:hypothetical protein [Myxococcales bacterium]
MRSRIDCWASLLAIAVGVFACRGSQAEQEGPAPIVAPSIAPPRIELAGCRARTADGCALPADAEAKLHLWLELQPQATVAVTVDGAAITPERTAVDGGVGLTVAVPSQARELRVEGLD